LQYEDGVRSAVLVATAAAVGIVAAAVRVPAIRDAVREPITKAVVAVVVTPWAQRAAWTEARPLPSTMLEPAAAVVDGRLYVFGGFVTGTRAHEFPAITRVALYDPGADAWSGGLDLPEAVTHANAVVVDHEVWSAGGFVGDDPGSAVATVRRFDTIARRWSAGPPLPGPVAGGTLALVARTLHYVGGFAPDRDTVVPTHWALDVDAALAEGAHAHWSSRAPLHVARGHLASAVVGGRLFAIGGQVRHDTDPVDLADVEVYEPADDAWTTLASLPTPRSHFEAATFVDHGRIVVVGGRNNTTSLFIKGAGLADVLVYDPSSNHWTTRPGLPVGIESPVALPVGGTLVVTAGATFGDVVPQRRTFLGALP
jgi:N-acetylneuraminic acid mutarotase